jgi:hypothetical protein
MDITPTQIREAFSRAPYPIREFIAEGGLSEATTELGTRYAMHTDVIGTFNKIMSMVLLGLIRPADLPRALSEQTHIDPGQISALIGELNTRIFVPLQGKVKEEGPGLSYEERLRESSEEQPAAYRTTQPASTLPAPKLEVTPATEIPSGSTPMYNLARPDALVPAPPAPEAVRTMQADMQTLQPSPRPGTVTFSANPTHATPSRSFQTASIPVPAHIFEEKPVELPSLHQTPTPVSQPVSAPVAQIPAPSTNPISKSYASDPYREPI